MPTALLADRALLSVIGEDAEHFLQNILTVDLDGLESGVAMPGALLSPQGKIMFDFLISRADGGFDLDVRADVADDFLRRLMMYRLRARVAISKREQGLVAARWGSDSSADEVGATATRLRDARFHGEIVERIYGDLPPPLTPPLKGEGDHEASPLVMVGKDRPALMPPSPLRGGVRGGGATSTSSAAEWHAFRIASGIPESGADYALGDAFPHDVLLDQTGGVGFRKGCYIGQEVVSRMQHRGTARRRFLIAEASSALPPSGSEISAGGRAIGTLGSVAGAKGLALVRIDKVKAAMDGGLPILAGDTELSLSIPAWARFGFPEAAAAGDDA